MYQSILGGDLVMSTYEESKQPVEEKYKDQIVHALLESDGMTLMASDSAHKPVDIGDNINLSLAGSDETMLANAFAKLSEGGTVKMKLEKQFWGDTFGMVTDKFRINWMVNISQKK